MSLGFLCELVFLQLQSFYLVDWVTSTNLEYEIEIRFKNLDPTVLISKNPRTSFLRPGVFDNA